MGKGANSCEREALVFEYVAPGVKLSVKPRKERTGWMTEDGRIYFSRYGKGWSVINRRSPMGTPSPDRKLLQAMGIVSSTSPAMVFDSLKAAQQAVEQVFKGTPNPPSSRVVQRPIAYDIEGIAFKVQKLGAYWQLKLGGEAPFGLRYHKELKLIEARVFSSRALALKFLESWVHENYLELDSKGVFNYKP